MIGVLLLSKDGFYADKSGSVDWGPGSDKIWLRSFIRNEIVIVGHNTFESIRDFEGLLCLPTKWLVSSRSKIYGVLNALRFCKDCHEAFPKDEDPTVNFGGPKNLIKYPPDKIIVHKTYDNLDRGLKLEPDFFKDYEIFSTNQEPEYEVINYVKKK